MNDPVTISGNQLAQHGFLWDLLPGETLYQAGLGSGKTWAGARKLLILHGANQCQGMAVAPTYGDLQRFVIPAIIKAAADWGWPCKNNTSADVPHLQIGKYPILVLSAEDPKRFAGFEVGHIWVDEAARIKSDDMDPLKDAPTQIRGRLRHPDARSLHILWTTTPEGVETFVQRDFTDKPLPSARKYIGQTSKNSALPPSYMQSLLSAMPAELAKQYLEGEAISMMANRAHPGFIFTANEAHCDWDPRLPLHLGSDYNVDPMAWIAAQVVGETLVVLDELFLTGGTTVDIAMHQAHNKGWGKYVVQMHPDKSAKARSTVGDPEFLVMQRTATALGWRHAGSSAGVNPPVASRIANLSRLCLDAANRRRLLVHPRCVRVIDELNKTGRLKSGEYDPGSHGSRGHILDALGYVAWDTFGPKPVAGAVSY